MAAPFLPHAFPVHIIKRCAKVGDGDFPCEEKRKKWRVEHSGVQAAGSRAAVNREWCSKWRVPVSLQALCLCWLEERLKTPFLLLKLLNSQAQQAGGIDKFLKLCEFSLCWCWARLVLCWWWSGALPPIPLLVVWISYSVDRSLLLPCWLRVLSVCSKAVVVPWWTSLSVWWELVCRMRIQFLRMAKLCLVWWP